MIRHEYKRKTVKKRSLKSLRSYLKYLADPDEKDHGPKGMVLIPGRNRLCKDDSPRAFERAVRDQHKNYLKVREGLPGKRSAILWEEIIYCLGKGVHHRPEEREFIENLIISRILPDSPSRPTWHMNPKTGMDDLHIPFAAKTRKGKMTLARTEVSLAKRLRALDQEIADYLNSRTHSKRKHVIKSARRAADEKAEKRHRRRGVPMPCPLPEQLARLAGDEEITLENIQRCLGDLEITHKPTRNGNGLKLTYPKLRKAGKKYRNAKRSYSIRDLVLRTKEARFDLDLVKNPEKYQDEVVADSLVAPAPAAEHSDVSSEMTDTASTEKEEKAKAQKRKTKSKNKNDEIEIN